MRLLVSRGFVALFVLVSAILVQGLIAPSANAATISLAACKSTHSLCFWDKDAFKGTAWSFSGTGCYNVPSSFDNKANSAANVYNDKWSYYGLYLYKDKGCKTRFGYISDGKAATFGQRNVLSSVYVSREGLKQLFYVPDA